MDPVTLFGAASIGVVMLVLMGSVISVYQKVPPSQAMIVYGAAGTRVITEGGAPVWPMIENRAYISLEVMSLDVVTAAPALTANRVPVKVKAVAQVKVRRDREALLAAAEMMLGKSEDEIKALVHECLTGALRAVVGTLTLEQIEINADELCMKVQQSSIPNLAKFGMTVISFTLGEVTDLRSQRSGALYSSARTSDQAASPFIGLVESAYAVDNVDSTASINWLTNRLSQLDQIADILTKLDCSESAAERSGLATSKQALLSGFESTAKKLESLKDGRLRRLGRDALVSSFSLPDEAV